MLRKKVSLTRGSVLKIQAWCLRFYIVCAGGTMPVGEKGVLSEGRVIHFGCLEPGTTVLVLRVVTARFLSNRRPQDLPGTIVTCPLSCSQAERPASIANTESLSLTRVDVLVLSMMIITLLWLLPH